MMEAVAVFENLEDLITVSSLISVETVPVCQV